MGREKGDSWPRASHTDTEDSGKQGRQHIDEENGPQGSPEMNRNGLV